MSTDARRPVEPGAGPAAVTVVVPIYNKVTLLRPSLDSIVTAAGRRHDVEVVLVDNHSTDGSYELALEYAGRAAVHRLSGGISRLRNWGARQGSGRIVSFIDSDVVVPPDYFDRLVAEFDRGLAPALGCEYHLPDDPVWVERVWHELTVREDDGYRSYLNAGNFAMTRDLFERVGGFPEDFETGEDTELGARIVAMGERIYQSQALAAQHLGNSKHVRGFYRRMRWHGLGITDGRRIIVLGHRSTVMMLVDVACLVGAAFALLVPVGSLATRIAVAAALVLFVPVLTYAYRVAQVRRAVNPFAALLLVQVLYLARASAFATVLRRTLRQRRPDATRPSGQGA